MSTKYKATMTDTGYFVTITTVVIDVSGISDDALLKLADDIFVNNDSNAISRTFAYAVKEGKFNASTKPRIIPGLKDVIRDLNKKYPHLNIENITIQKAGGKLDIKPDLKIQ